MSCTERKTATYSGGQRSRLDIAIGLMHRPQVVFLDEPTTGLDPQARAHLWDEFRCSASRRYNGVPHHHYLEEADALCDRLAMIDHGAIVSRGVRDEPKRQVPVTRSRSRSPMSPPLPQVSRHLPVVRRVTNDGGVMRLYVDRAETAMPAVMRALEEARLEMTSRRGAQPE